MRCGARVSRRGREPIHARWRKRWLVVPRFRQQAHATAWLVCWARQQDWYRCVRASWTRKRLWCHISGRRPSDPCCWSGGSGEWWCRQPVSSTKPQRFAERTSRCTPRCVSPSVEGRSGHHVAELGARSDRGSEPSCPAILVPAILVPPFLVPALLVPPFEACGAFATLRGLWCVCHPCGAFGQAERTTSCPNAPQAQTGMLARTL